LTIPPKFLRFFYTNPSATPTKGKRQPAHDQTL
jgi:hypothetical protein